jgi:hypothetical protein
MGHVDRRRAERFNCDLEIEEVNKQPCPYTYLRDISHLGAQLETSHQFATGNSIEVGLSLPAETGVGKNAYRLAAQVVWIIESAQGPKRYRLGLSFFTPFTETTKILGQLH